MIANGVTELHRCRVLKANKTGPIMLIGFHELCLCFGSYQSSSFNLEAQVDGERYSKVIAGPPQGKPTPKDRLGRPRTNHPRTSYHFSFKWRLQPSSYRYVLFSNF